MGNPTYGGAAIFGYSVTITHTLNATAEQLNAFFGLSGTQSLFGGLRGRVFQVKGVLFGQDMATLNAAEATYLSFIDGVARDLVDTRGRTWPSVLVKALVPPPQGRVLQDARGFYLPYKGLLQGLI